jgi:hypothetical protein
MCIVILAASESNSSRACHLYPIHGLVLVCLAWVRVRVRVRVLVRVRVGAGALVCGADPRPGNSGAEAQGHP